MGYLDIARRVAQNLGQRGNPGDSKDLGEESLDNNIHMYSTYIIPEDTSSPSSPPTSPPPLPSVPPLVSG